MSNKPTAPGQEETSKLYEALATLEEWIAQCSPVADNALLRILYKKVSELRFKLIDAMELPF